MLSFYLIYLGHYVLRHRTRTFVDFRLPSKSLLKSSLYAHSKTLPVNLSGTNEGGRFVVRVGNAVPRRM